MLKPWRLVPAYPTWNRLQRIKSVKMGVETSDKNQCSYFYVLNPFLKFSSGGHIDQLLNATHLLVKLILQIANASR